MSEYEQPQQETPCPKCGETKRVRKAFAILCAKCRIMLEAL